MLACLEAVQALLAAALGQHSVEAVSEVQRARAAEDYLDSQQLQVLLVAQPQWVEHVVHPQWVEHAVRETSLMKSGRKFLLSISSTTPPSWVRLRLCFKSTEVRSRSFFSKFARNTMSIHRPWPVLVEVVGGVHLEHQQRHLLAGECRASVAAQALGVEHLHHPLGVEHLHQHLGRRNQPLETLQH